MNEDEIIVNYLIGMMMWHSGIRVIEPSSGGYTHPLRMGYRNAIIEHMGFRPWDFPECLT